MKADEQLKCKDCDWYGSCEYFDRRKETSQICKMFNNTWKFVAEIEKLKAKIEEKCSILHITLLTTEEVFEVLDNRISELKGESK